MSHASDPETGYTLRSSTDNALGLSASHRARANCTRLMSSCSMELYEADVVMLYGDIAGKTVVAILKWPNGT